MFNCFTFQYNVEFAEVVGTNVWFTFSQVEKEAEVTKEVAEEQLSTDNKVAAENEKNKEKLSKEEVSASEEKEVTPENDKEAAEEEEEEEEDDDEAPVIKKDPKSMLRYSYPEGLSIVDFL